MQCHPALQAWPYTATCFSVTCLAGLLSQSFTQILQKICTSSVGGELCLDSLDPTAQLSLRKAQGPRHEEISEKRDFQSLQGPPPSGFGDMTGILRDSRAILGASGPSGSPGNSVVVVGT